MDSIIETCALSHTLTISRVLTGLWQIADMERDGQTLDPIKTAQSMKPYLDAGFSTFDMADHYGSAEIIAGAFQQSLSDPNAVQLLTKWVPQPGQTSKEEVWAAVVTALNRLQSKKIDLLQYHAWNYADPNWLDCLFWLQELKQEGLIANLGLTNFDTAHLRIVLASGIQVVSNQVCHSVIDQRAGGAMATLCKEHNIKLLAFGTVAGGFLTDKWLGKPEPVLDDSLTWSQMKYKRFIDEAGGWEKFQQLLNTLSKVAKRHNVSIANVASRFMLEQPAVGGVIIGARLGKSEHVQENTRLFQFSLTEEDKLNIKRAQEALTPIPGDCGDEYRKPPFLTASGDLSHHVDSLPPPFPTLEGSDGRTKALSGTIWEDLAGFSRAVRKGNRILISGTTATLGNKAIGGNDPAAQAHFVIDKIEGALQSLGGTLEQVVRTRIFVRHVNDWEPVSRAHGERFKTIQPANTLVKAEIIGDEYLVEMEAEAIVD
ncbi:MAG TPA: aldo/keto reductase [Cyclobacteriaceae bacterium]|nr:aldo/keto reductase [Cyclobacteriaceae bacterium]